MKGISVLSAKDPDLEVIISPLSERVYRFDFSFADVHLFRFGSFPGFRGRYYGTQHEALMEFAYWLVKSDHTFSKLDPQTTLVSLYLAECMGKAKLHYALYGITKPDATATRVEAATQELNRMGVDSIRNERFASEIAGIFYSAESKPAAEPTPKPPAELSLSDFKVGQVWRTRKGMMCKIISITSPTSSLDESHSIESDLYGRHWHFPNGRSILGSDDDHEDDLIELISEEDVLDASAEQDPNGIDQHSPGSKLDAHKTKLDLVLGGFSRALNAVAQVGTYGAIKYTPDGWRVVPDGINRYSDAMMRHYLAAKAGRDGIEEKDPESNLLHAAHLAWNALARLELILQEMEG